MTTDLDAFFHPRSVAVVGASDDPAKVGYALLRNLLYGRIRGDEDRDAGFPGEVFAVNRRGGEVQGVLAHPALADIGRPVDLMLVAIPPRFIPDLVDEAGELGIRNTIVISAGFAEMGEEGRALQDEMVARARKHSMRLVGPNCLGILRPSSGVKMRSMPRGGRTLATTCCVGSGAARSF